MNKGQEGASAEAILILGMHRSATSVLTRILNLHGLPLSQHLLGANSSNPFGHWESSEAIAINDELLSAIGRSWDDIRRLPKGWMETHAAFEAKQRIRILLESDFKDCNQWLLKEPRICRLAPIWLEVIQSLGITAKIVIPVRPVAEVALSLLRRDGMAIDKGALLWLDHILEAEFWSRDLPRVFVSHRQVVGNWRHALQQVTHHLNLKLHPPDNGELSAIDQTVNERGVNTPQSLGHQSPFYETEIEDACNEIYSLLIENQDENFRSRLDELRFLRNSICIGIESAYRDVDRKCRWKQEKVVRRLEMSEALRQLDSRIQSLESDRTDFISRMKDTSMENAAENALTESLTFISNNSELIGVEALAASDERNSSE